MEKPWNTTWFPQVIDFLAGSSMSIFLCDNEETWNQWWLSLESVCYRSKRRDLASHNDADVWLIYLCWFINDSYWFMYVMYNHQWFIVDLWCLYVSVAKYGAQFMMTATWRWWQRPWSIPNVPIHRLLKNMHRFIDIHTHINVYQRYWFDWLTLIYTNKLTAFADWIVVTVHITSLFYCDSATLDVNVHVLSHRIHAAGIFTYITGPFLG